jgi:hypothetical protein
MKKLFLFSLILGFTACGNSGTTKEASDTTAPNTPAIENVNGNIPDRSNSISLDTKDTTVNTDSVPR